MVLLGGKMDFKKYIKQLDYTLIFTMLILFSIGLVAIRVATNIENFTAGDPMDYIIKQSIAFTLGFIGII